MQKQNIKLIIIILLIVTLATSATYAFLNLSAQNNTATGQGGCFNVGYSGQEITDASLQSTTNYKEGAHSQITLYKDATCKIYTEASIYLHTNTNSDIPLANNNAFKYIILNGSTKIAEGIITRDEKTLATVTLTTEQKVYDVYIWIDSNISNGAYHNKSFSGYLYANSVQTSTFK